ncbi:MAG TPA: hypothetical protein VJN93_13635 [Candidatus Acidoferrum sp.]|nr:hypothetical protein [Candidatus Acidoferrum sp.]
MERTATVQIGRFSLQLVPLEEHDLASARKAWHRLAVAQLAPVASVEWLSAYSDALGFIFLAARKNHPHLSLADFDDEAEPGEIVSAFKALARLMHEQWGCVWEWPGNEEMSECRQKTA